MVSATATTLDRAEIDRFGAIAQEWWDPSGKFAPLHRVNPIRLAYIRDHACGVFGRDERSIKPLAGLRAIDIGCGGGLVAEPLARMGAHVVGIDGSPETIGVAALHAVEAGLRIDYRVASAEAVAEQETFDLVLALEVVEHVADVAAFLRACAALVSPGGLLVLSTLNRTARSFALGIVGLEYVLGWLPRGTHDWRKFLRPSEIAAHLRAGGLELRDVTGLVFDPLRNRFRLDRRDLAVNYLLSATKPGTPSE